MKQNRRVQGYIYALVWLACAGFSSLAQASQKTWLSKQTGPPLHAGATQRTQVFQPPRQPPVSGIITNVQIGFRYAGPAVLKTQLCHQRSGKCVPVYGSSLETSAFQGLDANSMFMLKHVLWSWAGPSSQLHIRSHLQVRYQSQ